METMENIMKKTLLIFAAAFAVASCTKTETWEWDCGAWFAEQDAAKEDTDPSADSVVDPDNTTPDVGTEKTLTGLACTQDSECYTGSCFCGPNNPTKTNCFSMEETVKGFNPESDWEDMIPGGMCAKFMCNPKKSELNGAECGPGAYCFDVTPLFGAPLGLCFRYCDDYDDCRYEEGYVCYYTGVEGQRACLPAKMIPDIPCGDGKCDATEKADTCPRDCFCGNGTCDNAEDATNCAEDCQ